MAAHRPTDTVADEADVSDIGAMDTAPADGVSVAVPVLDSWIMKLKPPSVVSSFRSCTVPPPYYSRSNLLGRTVL
jgi:hypothetical protein